MSDTQSNWKDYARKIIIAVVVIASILLIVGMCLYLMYYQYSLLTGTDKLPYTLTTATKSSSYVDLTGDTIACIWPIGSIEYRPNDAKVEQMAPVQVALQYLPAITDGQWPTTFTYSLLYSNVFGPYSIATPQMVTQTTPTGQTINLSYPIGSTVTATIDKKLNLVCLFQSKGNIIDNTVSAKEPAGTPVDGSSSSWWAAHEDLLDDRDVAKDVPAGGTTKSAFMFRRGASYL